MLDLSALDEITLAVESGAGLPDVVRAAARALDASLVVRDRAGQVLAVAARSPADERSLEHDADDVQVIELRVADEPVGSLRMRARSGDPGAAVLRVVTTLVAGEVERLRAPERASQAATASFLHAILEQKLDAADVMAMATELDIALEGGAGVLVARVHPLAAPDDGWRQRVLSVAERGARAVAPGAIAAPSPRDQGVGAEVVVLVPGSDGPTMRRAADGVLRELQSSLAGCTFALGRSRRAADPADLHRAGYEALLAANVAEGDPEHPMLAFEDTGAYRLLLPAMVEDPAELQRFYADTVEPLIAYDQQYETDLVGTVEAFLDCDGNVAATAQKLFTHRHTVRYRLERVKELSDLDMSSTDGREKLSLGLKAMRVLGVAHRGGPATEQGAKGGRVPKTGR